VCNSKKSPFVVVKTVSKANRGGERNGSKYTPHFKPGKENWGRALADYYTQAKTSGKEKPTPKKKKPIWVLAQRTLTKKGTRGKGESQDRSRGKQKKKKH